MEHTAPCPMVDGDGESCTCPVTDDQYRTLAKKLFEVDGECEIDDNAIVSRSEDQEGETGAYIQAWVWVRKTEVR